MRRAGGSRLCTQRGFTHLDLWMCVQHKHVGHSHVGEAGRRECGRFVPPHRALVFSSPESADVFPAVAGDPGLTAGKGQCGMSELPSC